MTDVLPLVNVKKVTTTRLASGTDDFEMPRRRRTRARRKKSV